MVVTSEARHILTSRILLLRACTWQYEKKWRQND